MQVAPDAAAPEPEDGIAPEIIYESVTLVDAEGNVLAGSTAGSVTREVLQRAGRPYSYFDEDFVYHEQAWSRSFDDGSMEHGYRILRSANPTPVANEVTAGPPAVDAAVEQRIAATGVARVLVRARNFPEWDVPLKPSMPVAAEDLALYAVEREAALLDRELLSLELTDGAAFEIEESGSTVIERPTRSAAVVAEIDAAALEALKARGDLLTITLDEAEGALFWGMGYGGIDSRLGFDRFIAQGFTGERANPTRHSYGDITVAVSDSMIEDEACFLKEGICTFWDMSGNCLVWDTDCQNPSRIQELIDCADIDGDGINCETCTNFPDTDLGESNHGTAVTSVVVADYGQDQCGGFTCGDCISQGNCTTNHTTQWKDQATGMAPEARLISIIGTGQWKSIEIAHLRNADILNGSWGTCVGDSQTCNLTVVDTIDLKVEDAYDDGVFPVFAAGNNLTSCSGGSCAAAKYTSCTLASPADQPKAFAVNAFDASTTNCNATYNTCLLNPCSYRLGGVDAYTPNLSTGAVSGVAVLAPDRITHVTNEIGNQGTVGLGTSRGTSIAAPGVAGMAALVKDQFLSIGTWVNNPGWMHVLMLAMTDRAYESSPGTIGYKLYGTDPEYGLGRLRLRLFGTGGGLGAIAWSAYSLAFTSSSSAWVATLWPTPVHSSTSIVKCVLYQEEDMSLKGYSVVSDIDIRLALHQTGAGGNCSPAGVEVAAQVDPGQDTKSMVALDSTYAPGNKCVRVTLTPTWVHSAGINVKLFCYAATVSDNAPPSG